MRVITRHPDPQAYAIRMIVKGVDRGWITLHGKVALFCTQEETEPHTGSLSQDAQYEVRPWR